MSIDYFAVGDSSIQVRIVRYSTAFFKDTILNNIDTFNFKAVKGPNRWSFDPDSIFSDAFVHIDSLSLYTVKDSDVDWVDGKKMYTYNLPITWTKFKSILVFPQNLSDTLYKVLNIHLSNKQFSDSILPFSDSIPIQPIVNYSIGLEGGSQLGLYSPTIFRKSLYHLSHAHQKSNLFINGFFNSIHPDLTTCVVSGASKFNVAHIPFDIQYGALYQPNQNFTEVFQSPNAYFRIQYDAEQLYSSILKPKSPSEIIDANKKQLLQDRNKIIAQHQFDLPKDSISSLRSFDSNSSGFNSSISQFDSSGVKIPSVNFDSTYFQNLGYFERIRYKKDFKKLNQINSQLDVLNGIDTTLPSITTLNKDSLNFINSLKDNKLPASLRNLNSLQIGLIQPVRMEKNNDFFPAVYRNLSGAKLGLKINNFNDLTLVYGKMRRDFFFNDFLSDDKVIEAALNTKLKSTDFSLVHSQRIPQPSSQWSSSARSFSAFEVQQHFKFFSLKAYQDFSQDFKFSNGSSSLSALITLKQFRLEGFIERVNGVANDFLQLNANQNLTSLGAKTRFNLFNNQLNIVAGYSSNYSDSLKRFSNWIFECYSAFKGFPTISFAYRPMANYQSFVDPINNELFTYFSNSNMLTGSIFHNLRIHRTKLSLFANVAYSSNVFLLNQSNNLQKQNVNFITLAAGFTASNKLHRLKSFASYFFSDNFNLTASSIYSYKISKVFRLGTQYTHIWNLASNQSQLLAHCNLNLTKLTLNVALGVSKDYYSNSLGIIGNISKAINW